MRIVNVIIVAIFGIMITVVSGYAAHAAIGSFYTLTNSTLRSDVSGDALDTLDMIYNYTGNIALQWVALTVIGFIIWFFMSTQNKERYTGVYE